MKWILCVSLMFSLLGCIKKLEEQTEETKNSVIKSYDEIVGSRQDQTLQGALLLMTNSSIKSEASRVRGAIALFDKGKLEFNDAGVLTSDQFWWHLGAIRPLPHVNVSLTRPTRGDFRNVSIVARHDVTSIRKNKKAPSVPTLSEDTFRVLQLAIERAVEALEYPEKETLHVFKTYEERRIAAFKLMFIGPTVMGATEDIEMARFGAPEEMRDFLGVKLTNPLTRFLVDTQTRHDMAREFKFIWEKYRLSEKRGDSAVNYPISETILKVHLEQKMGIKY